MVFINMIDHRVKICECISTVTHEGTTLHCETKCYLSVQNCVLNNNGNSYI